MDGKETMNLNGVALSASLTVSDIDASLAWYRDVLGCEVAEKFEREGRLFAVSLSAGDARILINQDNGAAGIDRVKGAGFSLMITTDQNIDEIAAAIKARGGKLDSDPEDMRGRRAFRLRDPDGFRFAISSQRNR
jgi:catechol 2,3-dioxygenase-like lactoylglutathione lyase family enzyme